MIIINIGGLRIRKDELQTMSVSFLIHLSARNSVSPEPEKRAHLGQVPTQRPFEQSFTCSLELSALERESKEPGKAIRHIGTLQNEETHARSKPLA